jgi:hypothetical protein
MKLERFRRGTPVATYGSIFYYKALGPVSLDLINRYQPEKIYLVDVKGDVLDGPHRDHGLTVSVNFYFKAAGAVTSFWDETEETEARAYEGEKRPNLYKFAQLKERCRFVAEDGDAYVLDVSQIHSVKRNALTDERTFLQFTWSKLPYEQLLKRLKL